MENYTTKIHKKKNYNFSPEKKLKNSHNFNFTFSQLKDTKSETIYNKLKENNYEIIRNSFFLAEDEVSLAKYDAQLSGSTCILVFCIANRIMCANAGDSRAILVSELSKKTRTFISK